MTEFIDISGGPDEQIAAAIAAVVHQLLVDESKARANPAQAPRQSPWVLAWRPREVAAALPSERFEAMPWSELEAAEEPAAE